MTSTLFITLNNDIAGVERVLQCARFRRFAVHSFAGESTNELTFITLKVSGASSLDNLIAQMCKLHCVRDIDVQ